MIRPILRYGDSGLSARAKPVEAFDDRLRQLIDDMIETMYAAPGVGLAATQVGMPLRVLVVDTTTGKAGGQLITLVNPEFVERDGMQLEEEGCLSVPGFNATVVRPSRAVIRGVRPTMVRTRSRRARPARACVPARDGSPRRDRLRRSPAGIKKDLIVRKIHKLKRSGKW